MTGNYMQWIILLLVVGASVVSWVIKKLQEEQERRRIREEAARRELERLRTGREPGEGRGTAVQMQRAQELQARRQQQLQELRRRQQERSSQQQPQMHLEKAGVGPTKLPTARTPNTAARTASQGPVWVPGSSGTTVPSRRPPQQQQVRRTPTQQQTTPRSQPLPRPQISKSRQQPVSRTVPMRSGRAQFPQAAPAPTRPVAPTAPTRPEGPGHPREAYAQYAPGIGLLATIKPTNSAEWRRAIIMHEILSPSVSERDRLL